MFNYDEIKDRQGELVFVKKTDDVDKTYYVNRDKGNKKIDGVIAFGETSGHKHQLQGNFEYYEDFSEGSLKMGTIVALDDVEVVHEEHNSLKLERGIWEVYTKREYSEEDEFRRVID